jgi:hypothetical protein
LARVADVLVDFDLVDLAAAADREVFPAVRVVAIEVSFLLKAGCQAFQWGRLAGQSHLGADRPRFAPPLQA